MCYAEAPYFRDLWPRIASEARLNGRTTTCNGRTRPAKTSREREKDEMAAPDPTQELAIVFESDNPIALDLAKAALDEAGIQFAVLDEARIGFGVTPILNPVCRIQVAQACEGHALELMKDLFGSVNSELGERARSRTEPGHGHRQ